MMFESHIAFGVNLLALVAAAGLLGFTTMIDVGCKKLMKIVAYTVLIFGVLNILCNFYYTMKYWEDGYFKTPYGHSGSMMKDIKRPAKTPKRTEVPQNDGTNKYIDENYPDQAN